MRRHLFLIASVLVALAASAVRAQTVTPIHSAVGPQWGQHIEAELTAMTAWAAPGSTVVVAVRQKIPKGWHTYWRNPGDSGGATTLDWTLPPGVVAGDIVWPLPERQAVQGLMNYGYSGEAWLPVPIEIPATARIGETLVLRVDALFLVCSAEMCVPDPLTLQLNIPIKEGAPSLTDNAALINKALEDAPRPAGITASATLSNGALTLSATGGPLAEGRVRGAVFFPYEGGIIAHAAAQDGERGPHGLRLKLRPGRKLTSDGLKDPVVGVLATDIGAFEITAMAGQPLAGTDGGGVLTAQVAGADWTGFLQAALFALIGGLVLNLMPCVFPVLAMKAAALAKTAGDARAARSDGLSFLAGVLTCFVGLAALLLLIRAGGQAAGWGFQLQSPVTVSLLTLLMLGAALNLSGIFHVGTSLSAGVGGFQTQRQGGYGSFFTGVMAVLVASPCTAPFMASALGAALVMPWPMTLAVFVMLGLGFALPFVAVSLSPGLINRLPRPGLWMERLKLLLALPMYATALWLGWVFWRQGGDYAAGLMGGAVTCFGLSLWLAGRIQARMSSAKPNRLWVAASMALMVACGVLIVMASQVAKLDVLRAPTASALPSEPWSPEAVQAALAQGRPVLVNFTADWCVTCKINEAATLGSPAVAAAFRHTNTLYLVADWSRRDDRIATELSRHGRSGVPLYLLYTPGQSQPRILPQLLTKGLVVAALASSSEPPRGER